jgi:hypothetical protein
MLSALIINILKSLFGFLFNEKEPELTEREKQIFNKELSVKNKSDMLERIDYWIVNNNTAEAKKIAYLYINHNEKDEEILKRLNLINKMNQ